mmetsp:Transcript_3691/g.6774  ORF Transcript_3691/g.6774 Transcript_3691/m.6774 type:complete len:248 (+) Transcript_3691:226-969(+)
MLDGFTSRFIVSFAKFSLRCLSAAASSFFAALAVIFFFFLLRYVSVTIPAILCPAALICRFRSARRLFNSRISPRFSFSAARRIPFAIPLSRTNIFSCRFFSLKSFVARGTRAFNSTNSIITSSSAKFVGARLMWSVLNLPSRSGFIFGNQIKAASKRSKSSCRFLSARCSAFATALASEISMRSASLLLPGIALSALSFSRSASISIHLGSSVSTIMMVLRSALPWAIRSFARASASLSSNSRTSP